MEALEQYFWAAPNCESDNHDGMKGLEVSDRYHNGAESRYFGGMDTNILLKFQYCFSRLQP